MTERVIIAYVMIALLAFCAVVGIVAWRRAYLADQALRRGGRPRQRR